MVKEFPWVGYLLKINLLLFPILSVGCFLLNKNSKQTEIFSSRGTNPVFQKFQRIYFVVYLPAVYADWLQIPYLYKIYDSYGFLESQIAILYIFGLLSSLLFGSCAGTLSHRYGRKPLCLLFILIYCVSAGLKTSSNYGALLVSEIMRGAATTVLFAAMEAWYIHEHTEIHDFPKEWIPLTFNKASFWNGILAVAAGLFSFMPGSYFPDGPKWPVGVSIPCFLFSGFMIATKWTDNCGNCKPNFKKSLVQGFRSIIADPRILLLGAIQSAFESIIVVFAFLWTPVLAQTTLYKKYGLLGQLPIPNQWTFVTSVANRRLSKEPKDASSAESAEAATSTPPPTKPPQKTLFHFLDKAEKSGAPSTNSGSMESGAKDAAAADVAAADVLKSDSTGSIGLTPNEKCGTPSSQMKEKACAASSIGKAANPPDVATPPTGKIPQRTLFHFFDKSAFVATVAAAPAKECLDAADEIALAKPLEDEAKATENEVDEGVKNGQLALEAINVVATDVLKSDSTASVGLKPNGKCGTLSSQKKENACAASSIEKAPNPPGVATPPAGKTPQKTLFHFFDKSAFAATAVAAPSKESLDAGDEIDLAKPLEDGAKATKNETEVEADEGVKNGEPAPEAINVGTGGRGGDAGAGATGASTDVKMDVE